MTTRASNRMWNNLITVTVCEQGYEWRIEPYAHQGSKEPRLHARYTELVESGNSVSLKATDARTIYKSGVQVAKSLVAELRDLTDRLDWLLSGGDPSYQYIFSTRESVFTPTKLAAIRNASPQVRTDWARTEIAQFADRYGTLTNEAQTLGEWANELAAFRSIDRLCTAIKQRRWEDVERCMRRDDRRWWYSDRGIIEVICSDDEYWEMEDGGRLDWWAIAGRPSERAKMAFAKIINKRLTNAFSVHVQRLSPGEGTMLPGSLMTIAYFLLWRRVANPDVERYCVYCDSPMPADKKPGAKYCSDACKVASWRRKEKFREPQV